MANPDLEVRSCGNAVFLNLTNSRTAMLRYFNNNNNNNIPLLCNIIKHLFHIPPILVVWRRTTSQTGAFSTVVYALMALLLDIAEDLSC
jgi:hypothetical protein